MLSEKRSAFSGLLKNKGLKEERTTKVGLDAIDTSTTLESNKSLSRNPPMLRVVCPRSRRYNAVYTSLAGAGDVTFPRIATRERRHEHALRRE